MKKKKTSFILLAMVLTLALFGAVHSANATSTYNDAYNTMYGTNVGCSFCHTNPPSLNATGTKFKNSGFNYASIAPIPKVTAFNIPATSTSLTVKITAFTATDTILISGYMVTEAATPPGASATGWSGAPPKNHTFSSTGAKTLYAWVKDVAGVVSSGLSASTDITAPPPLDKIKPVVTGFSVSSPSTSLTVSITILTATDNVGVTGYMVTTKARAPGASSTKWSATPATSFTFPATTKLGAKTLYAWAKDAAKNVSKSLSASVTLSLTVAQVAQNLTSPASAPSGTVSTAPQTAIPDTVPHMEIWVGKWFKLNVENKGFYTGQSGLSSHRQSVPGYFKIWAWDSAKKFFRGTFTYMMPN